MRVLEHQIAILVDREKLRDVVAHGVRLAEIDKVLAEHLVYARSFEQETRSDRDRTRAEIGRALDALEEKIKGVKEEACQAISGCVKVSEFNPVRSIVYGLVVTILMAVVGTWLVTIGLKPD